MADPQYVPIIGNIVGDGEVVPRPPTDGISAENGISAEKLNERMNVLFPPIPWTRRIEATFDEAEIEGLDRFIKGHFKATRKRLTEEAAIRLLVCDALIGMGDLPLRK